MSRPWAPFAHESLDCHPVQTMGNPNCSVYTSFDVLQSALTRHSYVGCVGFAVDGRVTLSLELMLHVGLFVNMYVGLCFGDC